MTDAQRRFFDTFGYLVFRGMLKDELDWIEDEFAQVFVDHPYVPKHQGTARTCVVPFIDQRERPCTLLDHPAIQDVATGLIGERFNYLGGDGNYYVGDTNWHSDGWHSEGRFIKMAIYLDPLTAQTGCLRVIPGSHRTDNGWVEDVRRVGRAADEFGIHGRDVPCVPLETQPG
ncbi:MAG: phytanoyl-CoA dioxygenase family protein, partial [Candidatus Poribacteria bacterium]|nr:phytanoyl-CoA dioxygenase family protein [Candidatus Poribacteria bacterium]